LLGLRFRIGHAPLFSDDVVKITPHQPPLSAD
jgi:hypothetical protein